MLAIQNQQRYEQEKHLQDELESLSEVAREVAQMIRATADLNWVLDLILEKGLELMDVFTGSIMLFDDKITGDLRMAVQRGVPKKYLGARQALGEGIVGMAARDRRCYLVNDVKEGVWKEKYRSVIPNTRSELAVPLMQGEKLIGVINAESPKRNAFNEDHQKLLGSLAAHAVIAIQNAERFRQMEALREIDQTIIKAQEIGPTLNKILDYALKLTGRGAETGELRLIDPFSGDLVVEASRTPGAVDETWTRVPAGQGIVGWCAANCKPIS